MRSPALLNDIRQESILLISINDRIGSPPPGGELNNNRCDNQCNLWNRWNNAANILPGKFKGKTKVIEGGIFDNSEPHNAANFHHTLKDVDDYL
jgi:hypothetical protein